MNFKLNIFNLKNYRMPITHSSKVNTIHTELFLQYASTVKDDYWKAIFLDLSRGKFPKGYMYKDSKLMFRQKTKCHKITLPTSSAEELASLVIEFFKQTSSMFSMKDKQEHMATAITNQELDEEQLTSWSKVRRMKLQETLKSIYIDSLTEKYNLNHQEKNHLREVVALGYFLKAFPTTQISNGQITNIVGLQWNPETRRFSLPFKPKPKYTITGEVYPPTRPSTPVNGGRIMKIKRNTPLVKHSLFVEMWVKYLTSLNKNKKSLQDKLMDKISSSNANSTVNTNITTVE
jgi:hypothetical protein